jgi:hypothetical protein
VYGAYNWGLVKSLETSLQNYGLLDEVSHRRRRSTMVYSLDHFYVIFFLFGEHIIKPKEVSSGLYNEKGDIHSKM